MMRNKRTLLCAVAAWAVLLPPAFGAEETIDDFSSASNTAFITSTQVRDVTANAAPVSAQDTSVTGVLGGTRKVDVNLVSSPGNGLTAGVNLGVGLFQFSEDPLAQGDVFITYPSIPKGLDFAQGISILVNADAQAAITGYNIAVTLTDSGGSETVNMPTFQSGMAIPFDFSFSSFPSIDPSDLTQIEIHIIGGGSNDIQLDVATTFGTPPREVLEFCQDGQDNDNDGLVDCFDPDCLAADPCGAPAPALSPMGLGFTVLMLLGAGLLAMVRLRRAA